jgi:hypothetical protein
MNRLFVALDGDDAGQHVGAAVLMDDVQALSDISKRIDAGGKAAIDWVNSHGGQVISHGGDELTAMLDPSAADGIEELKHAFESASGFTATIGVGNTLGQAGKSLMAGKVMGKNMVVHYDEDVEHVLADTSDHAESGEANEEEQKIHDHYLSHMDGDMEPSDEEMHSDGDMEHAPEHDEEEMDLAPEMSDEETYEEEPEMQDEMSEDMQEEMCDHPECQAANEQIAGAIGDPEEHHEDMGEEPSEEEVDFQDEEPIQIPESDSMEEEEDPEKLVTQAADMQNDEPGVEDPSQEAEMADPEMAPEEDMLPEEESAQQEMDQPEQGEAPVEMQQPEGQDDLELLSGLISDSNTAEEIKSKVASVLDKFKNKRDIILSMKDQDPELYQSIIEMLQNMVEMAQALNGAQEEQQQPPMEASEQLPKM